MYIFICSLHFSLAHYYITNSAINVVWPPYKKDDSTKRWPSNKANHSCENTL